MLAVVSCGAMALALFATFGTLLGWHIYLITHNMTAIEVLGPNMLRWLWPASISHLKDGVSLPTSHDSS
ncbi:Uncharacterized protein TCM_043236 [Theobroma cacao]|uniref:S-acyltransferase n=1 Tax=Theobroma cacao TaxID=3641 RepID=A0A061FNV2_THECC|nr:Uncharacterized protein TCM_043236 [Theobroma cacao]